MFDYHLGLMTGIDLPIPELKTVIHQPTIKEISMVGETDFFIGIQLLCINKKLYIKEDTPNYNEITNFNLFMMIINEKQTLEKKAAVQQVLTLLFPQAKIIITPRSILLNQADENIIIDESNFEALQTFLKEQFCLKGSGQEQFNPSDSKAKEIAQKLMRARQKVAEQKMQDGSAGQSLFSQYLSTLVVGLNSITLKEACNLTMFQLYDLMERYSLYLNWDLDIKSRLAGGKPDHPAENWMKNIH